LDFYKEDTESKAHEHIKDKLSGLNWEEMQDLVAGILRAMGYKTIVSGRGSDRGRDIIASPDGLGLEDPRIIVEVKHRSGQMGAHEIRQFIGGLRPGNKGLYISTGGFTKEANYEAIRSTIPITLIELDLLGKLIIQYYDNFDPDTRALVPLTKIYWPKSCGRTVCIADLQPKQPTSRRHSVHPQVITAIWQYTRIVQP